MSPPTEVIVGPRTYELHIGGPEWKKTQKRYAKAGGFIYGETVHRTTRVIVRPNMDPIIERATVIHELLHAVINAGGDLIDRVTETKDGLEEFVCHNLESGLLALLRDNPLLVDYLTEFLP